MINEDKFIDSYNLYWLLKDENGDTYSENHNNISLSDFEVIYGNEVNEIILVQLRKVRPHD